MRIQVFLVVVVVVFALSGSALTATIPSFMKPCERRSPDFEDCIIKMGQDVLGYMIKGDPHFKVPPLDPLVLERVEVGDTKNQNAVGMGFTCKNCIIEGLKGGKVLNASIDMKGRHINMMGKLPRMSLKGDYSISGKVIMLPIVGQGKADITLNDVDYDYKTDYVLNRGRDDKDHLKIVKSSIDLKAGGSTIHLTNLFNGDKALGDQMNSFLNENWKEMLKEFGPAIGDAVSDMITLIINGVAKEFPFDDIILP